MTDKPCISIIIPVYNTEKYLKECLDSIINQPLKSIEVFCINDASTDGSLEILNDYVRRDPRVIVINNDRNHGLGFSKNRGLNAAKGKYILAVDSDDLLMPDILQKIYDRAEKDELDMLCCNFESFFDDGFCNTENRQLKRSYMHDYPGVYSGIDFFTEASRNHDCMPHMWGVLYRTEWIEKENFRFPEGVVHDDLLWTYRCYYSAERLGYFPEKIYRYRVRNGSLMDAKRSFLSLKSYYLIAEKMIQYRLEKNFPREFCPGLYDYPLVVKRAGLRLYQAEREVYYSQIQTEMDRTIIAAYEMELLGLQAKQREIDEIYQSKSWKLGNQLIQPFHKLKKMLTP